ncbi:MAG TPA: cupredoxin domain-containing protein [Candidatus Limnocylindria bacterium]
MARALGLAFAVLVVACSSAPQAIRTDSVRVFDDPAKPEKEWGYAPGVIEVARGTTVTFTNDGAVFHTITSDDPKRTFDMGASPKEKVQIRFDVAGTWSYHCGVHPDMKGAVKVCDGECR